MTFGITTTMGRKVRSCFYCWRSEMSGMNYNWITAENFFSFIATVRFKGFLLSRSCCFHAWCSVAYFLALKGVSTMTGKRNFEALQSPAFTSSWHSRNFLCHAFSSSTVHHNALYCNTLHFNAMERRGRSYYWAFPDKMSTTSACCSGPGMTSEGRSCAHAQSVQVLSHKQLSDWIWLNTTESDDWIFNASLKLYLQLPPNLAPTQNLYFQNSRFKTEL